MILCGQIGSDTGASLGFRHNRRFYVCQVAGGCFGQGGVRWGLGLSFPDPVMVHRRRSASISFVLGCAAQRLRLRALQVDPSSAPERWPVIRE
jgi:hypothetical protein